jgi:surface polysaccharide O-acyltransferase-like enzyme
MRLDGLLAGVILAYLRWFTPGLWQKIMGNPYKVLAAGVTTLAFSIWLSQGRTNFSASVFGFPLISVSLALIVVACISDKCLLGKRRVPGAKLIATVSFSLYLSHKMTWHVIRIYESTLVRAGGVQAFFIYAGAALLVGSLLFLVVERPFLLLRDRLQPRSSPRNSGEGLGVLVVKTGGPA